MPMLTVEEQFEQLTGLIKDRKKKIDEMNREIVQARVDRAKLRASVVKEAKLFDGVKWFPNQKENGIVLKPWVDEREEQSLIHRIVEMLGVQPQSKVLLAHNVYLERQHYGGDVQLRIHSYEDLKNFRDEWGIRLMADRQIKSKIAHYKQLIERLEMFEDMPDPKEETDGDS